MNYLFLLFCVVSIFTLVSSEVGKKNLLCGGRGYKDTYGICRCHSDYHGENCEYKYCPFGKSWLYPPHSDNSRNSPLRPCSDMGYCNIISGTCDCRSGYEGRACERLSCPSSSDSSNLICSGHGRCLSLREAGSQFDGITLINPKLNYNNWDADKIQGCICDFGWEGSDCSRKSCPKGRDPLSVQTIFDKDEIFVLQCQADSGYFSILVLGQFTEPIPFDSDPAYLKFVLENLPNVGNVVVNIEVKYPGVLPKVCDKDYVISTTIQFIDYPGDRPPIFLTTNASKTRTWPNGDEFLSLNENSPILRMATIITLNCPICPGCYGNVYFQYRDAFSNNISILNQNAEVSIKESILDIDLLTRSKWTNFNINVSVNSSTGAICSTSTPTETIISLYSDYGNIPHFGFIDGSFTSNMVKTSANISFNYNKGNGTLYECSNQGSCDSTSGLCQCSQLIVDGEFAYRAISSDGKGGKGNRGDCGFIEYPLNKCVINNLPACNGNGKCDNSSSLQASCKCYDDWFGLTCSNKLCPFGPAIFDEPILENFAHNSVECSKNGYCDRLTGNCVCNDGYLGEACQIRDCIRDSETGEPCSGHGICININEYYNLFGYLYEKPEASSYIQGNSNWDAEILYECLCSAKVSAGFLGNPVYPLVGANSIISGSISSKIPLTGYGNWDCSLRNCPKGHDSRKGRFDSNYKARKEIQRIFCQMNSNSGDFFYLKYLNLQSDKIYSYYHKNEIELAISSIDHLGNITVIFPNKDYDSIVTACDASVDLNDGGFLVQFDTELGDLPLLQIILPENLQSNDISILEYQNGYNTNEECSGSSLGYCDRTSGSCKCNKGRFSSDGQDSIGNHGDCSYLVPIMTTTDDLFLFGSLEKDFD